MHSLGVCPTPAEAQAGGSKISMGSKDTLVSKRHRMRGLTMLESERLSHRKTGQRSQHWALFNFGVLADTMDRVVLTMAGSLVLTIGLLEFIICHMLLPEVHNHIHCCIPIKLYNHHFSIALKTL